MKTNPNGLDLLATLIELLADQEGVKITYELKGKSDDDDLDE